MGRTPYVCPLGVPTCADHDIALRAFDQVGLSHLASRQYPEISGGERQLTLLARALAQQAPLLVLDDPTANLDLGNQVKVLQAVRGLAYQGYAVLMTSHLPDHAFFLHSRVALLAGRQACPLGRSEEILTDTALSTLYNTRIRVVQVAVPETDNPIAHVCIPMMHD